MATKPDAVCISTYPETHETYTLAALDKGCDAFIQLDISTFFPFFLAILIGDNQ